MEERYLAVRVLERWDARIPDLVELRGRLVDPIGPSLGSELIETLEENEVAEPQVVGAKPCTEGPVFGGGLVEVAGAPSLPAEKLVRKPTDLVRAVVAMSDAGGLGPVPNFQIPENLARALACAGRLRSLDLALRLARIGPEKVGHEYAELIATYPEELI